MPGYAILLLSEVDEARHAEFRSRQRPLLEAKGGKIIARGPVAEATDGDATAHRRIAVMEFPTVEQARAWIGPQSEPEYVALRELRDSACKCTAFVIEGT